MEGPSLFHRAPLICLFRFPVRQGMAILLASNTCQNWGFAAEVSVWPAALPHGFGRGGIQRASREEALHSGSVQSLTLSGKPGEQRTWMRRIIIPFPQSCRNILATDPFKGSHLYCALCLYCAAGNSPPPNPEMSFPPGGPTGSLLGYLPTLEQAGIVHARPRVRRVSQAAWGRRVRLHTRVLRRRDRVRQSRHRRVRSVKV